MRCKDCFLNDRPTWRKCLNMSHAYRVAIKQDPDKLCRAMRAVMKMARKMIKMDCCPDLEKMNRCDAQTGRPVCIECWARWATR